VEIYANVSVTGGSQDRAFVDVGPAGQSIVELWLPSTPTPAPPSGTGGTVTTACDTCHQFGPRDDSLDGGTSGHPLTGTDTADYIYSSVGDHIAHGAGDPQDWTGSDPDEGNDELLSNLPVRGRCSNCHGAISGYLNTHSDGTKFVNDGFIGLAGNGSFDEVTTRTCTLVDCHGGIETEAWGSGGTTCTTCHTDQQSVTHLAHTDSPTAYVPDDECDNCHPAGATTASHDSHSDGTPDILGGLGYNSGDGTCSSAGCHGNTAGADFRDSSPKPACLDCHDTGFIADGAGALPTSGLHATTNLTNHDDTLLGGSGNPCEKCHTASPTATAANHINGTFQNGGSTTYSWDATNIANGGYDRTNDYCAATCHSDGATWNREWSGAFDGTVTVGSDADDDTGAQQVCGNCHGTFAADWNIIGNTSHDNPSAVNDPDTLATSKTNHGICSKCHGWGHANYTAAMHNTGADSIQMNSTLGYDNVNPDATCAKECHNGQTLTMKSVSGWTDASVAGDDVLCGDCHTGGVTPTTASGAHDVHDATFASVASNPATIALCTDCHSHDGTIPNADHNNGSLNFKTSPALDYSAAREDLTGTCTNTAACHDSSTGNIQWIQEQTVEDDCALCHEGASDVDDVNGANDSASMIDAGDFTATGHGKGGVAKGCMDCHLTSAGHDFAMSGSNPFRLGNSYSDPDTFCSNEAAGCHVTSTGRITHNETNAGANRTPWGWSPKCTDCHDPHGDGVSANNIKMIQEYPTDGDSGTHGIGGTTEPDAVDFTTQADIAAGSYAFTDGNGICQVCHANTVSFLDDDTTPLGINHPASGLNPCSSCHAHTDGFKASGCSGCHGGTAGTDADGYWPDSSGGDDDDGQHLVHMTQLAQAVFAVNIADLLTDGTGTGSLSSDEKQKRLCSYCHPDPARSAYDPGGGRDWDTLHDDATIDVADGTYFSHAMWEAHPGTDWPATDNFQFTSGGDATGGTCASVNCHNNMTTSAANEWYVTATAGCTMCHSTAGGGTVDPTSGLHDVTPSISAELHDDTLLTDCEDCHGADPTTVSGHRNGTDDSSFQSNDTAGSRVNLVTDVGFTDYDAALNGGSYPDATTPTCSPTGTLSGCHGDGGKWARRWHENAGATDDSECAGCHGGFVLLGGTTYDWTFGQDTTNITDNEVSHDRNWDEAWSSDGTAEVMSSHSTCMQCHGTNGPTTSHAGYTEGDFWTTSMHGNSEITMNGPSGTGSGYDDANFDCNNAGTCHGDSATDHELENSNWTVGYGDFGAASCTSCHGYPPQGEADLVGSLTDSTDHTTTGFDDNTITAAALLAGHGECDTCHGISGDAGAASTAFGTPVSPYTVAGNHNQGSATMNGDFLTDGNANDTDYIEANYRCDAACHTLTTYNFTSVDSDNMTVELRDLGGACPGCHVGGTGGAPVIDYTSPHTDADGAGGADADCLACHGFHTNSGTNSVHIPTEYGASVLVPTLTDNYDTHYTAIQLGGSATTSYNETEAEMCWGCHYDNLVSDEGEFGVNNNPNTGDKPYDYGTLSTWDATNKGSWIGATWQSPNFSYKDAPLQSMHAANFDSGASGNDTAANIRCSYCHDVHDTGGGTNNGAGPYLRGTWQGNPFPEDGAPLDGFVYPLDGDGGVDLGELPRISALSTSEGGYRNTLGGYQIEANNPAPTPALTIANMAGLCEACHGDGNGSWSTTEIDTLNYFGTATQVADDWAGSAVNSSSNGHANSVLGGSGGGAAQATNIYNESIRGNTLYAVTTDDGIGGGSPAMVQQQSAGAFTYGFRGASKEGLGSVWLFEPNMDTVGQGSKAQLWNGTYTYDWGTVTIDNSSTIDSYHKFPCSKCHNPHASRLDRLLITNCLDIKHETWSAGTTGYAPIPSSVGTTNIAGESVSSTNLGRYWPFTTAANNCHREPSADGTGRNSDGNGWNNVTPW
jgi:hypothetical protein